MKLRRIALFYLPVLAAALTCSMIAAAPASAADGLAVCTNVYYPNPHGWPTDRCGKPIQPTTKLASSSHIGWTFLNLNYCPPGMMCAAVHTSSMNAWRWTGSAWTRTSLAGGWVYVYPYTGQWRWAWTQSTGWVAVSGGRFEIRQY